MEDCDFGKILKSDCHKITERNLYINFQYYRLMNRNYVCERNVAIFLILIIKKG